jgi:membrane protease YdiL (CAAX protease family)
MNGVFEPKTRRTPYATRILSALAIVFLACGLKNYLAYGISGTALCPYLCPSVMGEGLLWHLPFLSDFLLAQTWLKETLQGLLNGLFQDPHRLATTLVVAPIIEEAVYRGPFFLARKHAESLPWWALGLVLSMLFAMSHGRGGLSLFPLVVLGMGSLWLIATTGRFWPSIMLHFLYNFFFSSVSVYQSLWAGD